MTITEAGCAAGPSDQERLLVEVRERMVRVLTSRGVDRDLAEDLAQEGTLLVWRKLPQLRSRDRLGAWVATIALNRLRSHRRRQRIVAEEFLEDHSIDHAEPLEAAACHEGLERAARVLRLIGAECGVAVALRHGFGVGPETACRVLGVSPAELKRRVAVGLSRLRRRLAGRFAGLEPALRATA